MAVRGGVACIKYFLGIFNFFLSLCGLLLLISGFLLWLDSIKTQGLEQDLLNRIYYVVLCILMGTGAYVMLLGFLGSLGAGLESRPLLAAYFLLLILALALDVFVIVMIFTVQNELILKLQDLYTYVYLKFLATQRLALRITLIILHHVLDCCGLTGVLDQIVTDTCPAQTGLDIFTVASCPSTIASIFQRNGSSIQGVSIGLGVVIVLFMVLSVVLLAQIKNRQWPQACTQPIILTTSWLYPQQQQDRIPLILPTTPVEASPPFVEMSPLGVEASTPYEDDKESNKV